MFDSVEVYTDNYFTLYDLPFNTVYQYYIITLCDDGSESEPSQIYTFSISYTDAGNYTFTSNDTVFTLNLTDNPVYNIIINDSITSGETYTQYGFNESTAGTYQTEFTCCE